MTVETEQDIEGLKYIGRIVGLTLKKMQNAACPGITTQELDDIGRAFLEEHGARSAPELSYQFPAATCISVNEEIAHGIPGQRRLQPGDVVNIDVSAELDGYFADTGGTIVIPPTTPEKQRLCYATRLALHQAMEKARDGQLLSNIGKAIQKVAKEKGFKIVKNLCSHGVGRALHEDPKEIRGYFEPRDQRRLHEGLVITIEPFLATKANSALDGEDGWTLLGPKGNLSAQYEHTMIITKGKPILVTAV